MLLLRVSGWLSLRFAARRFWVLLFQDPPRSTREAARLAHGPPALPTARRGIVGAAPGLRQGRRKTKNRRCAAVSGQGFSGPVSNAPVG
jgi:hypothetical protein